MNIGRRFLCPACGFQIFNRRCAKCERCGALLPTELLLTAEQIAALDADHERSRKARAGSGSSGSAGADGTDFGCSGDASCGADGGGCD